MRKPELVVAHYEEPLGWLRDVPAGYDVTVYHKGGGLEDVVGNARIVPLPNVGREAHSYLMHVLSIWPWLDETPFVVFVQGNPFEHRPDFLQWLHDHAERTTMSQPVGWYLADDDATGHPHHPGLPLGRVWAHLWPPDEPGEPFRPVRFRFSVGAQYAVPGFQLKTIRTRTWYERALALLERPGASQRPGPWEAPWVFERLWPIIWGVRL